MKDDREKDSPESVAKLRRLSIGLSLTLLIYTFGQGDVGKEFAIFGTASTFKKPGVLEYVLIATMFYSTGFYWYHSIYLPLTRQKIRAYLKTDESMFIFRGDQESLKHQLARSTGDSPEKKLIHQLYRKVPWGMPPEHALVIGHGVQENETDVMQELAAKTAAHYFPGLQSDDIEITPSNDDSINHWGHVKSVNPRTRFWRWIEDLYLYLPAYLCAIALAAFFFIKPLFFLSPHAPS